MGATLDPQLCVSLHISNINIVSKAKENVRVCIKNICNILYSNFLCSIVEYVQ
jgi:hypothetical protein